MAKKRSSIRKSEGFTDPNRYLINSGDRCMNIKVQHLVTARHLIYSVYEMLDYDGQNKEDEPITISTVRKNLRQSIKFEGDNWVDKLEEEDTGRGRRDSSNRYESAERIARELFPKWFINYNNKALRFIVED